MYAIFCEIQGKERNCISYLDPFRPLQSTWTLHAPRSDEVWDFRMNKSIWQLNNTWQPEMTLHSLVAKPKLTPSQSWSVYSELTWLVKVVTLPPKLPSKFEKQTGHRLVMINLMEWSWIANVGWYEIVDRMPGPGVQCLVEVGSRSRWRKSDQPLPQRTGLLPSLQLQG